MAHTFDYKAGFLQPVDWRPREFNKAADLVADHVLDKRSNISTVNMEDLARHIKEFAALQIFCDGGYNGIASDSMAFVIVGYQKLGNSWQRRILGCRGLLVEGVLSAFQCEIGALDVAVETAIELAKGLPQKDASAWLVTRRTPWHR